MQFLLKSDRCDPNVINKSGQTPLHIVCHRGDIPLLKILATDRCDLNIQDGNGDTALHIGVENVEVVKCVLESGRSRCDIYNEEGLTPFHKAIANGIMASVEVMLKNGVNILQTSNDIFQYTPIHIACIHSRLDILKVLLSCESCDPNQQNTKGDTALHIVSRMRTGRELQFLEVLTSTPGINSTLVNLEGNAAIHTACMNSRLESLKVLLSCESCNPNQLNSKGDTALHIVCRMKTGRELQFLEMLTSTPGINPTLVNHERIASFDVVDSDGNTILHNACAEGNTTMVELLMKNGADVLRLNGCGDAPIHIACIHSQLDTMKVLWSYKRCDVNQQNSKGDTALHIVCRMRTGRELQFLEVLTSAPGINPTLLNLDGNAPIHTACMHCRLESLKVLLSCESCDPNQQNLKGDTALHIVCRMRTGDELQFFEMLTSTPGINTTLVNHEGIASFDVVDSDGNTILHNACAEGNTTMVELLMKNGADVLRLNGCGDAPIHIACIHSQLDTMKVLWSYKRCNVNQQNSKGDTALHIVCRMRTGRELQFLEVLTSIPGINPILVNHEGIAPFDVVGTDDNTLLHIACAKGNSTAVEFLVKNGADVLKLNRDGDAPIHIACEYSRLAILKIILECKTCDPNQKNIMKNTALHIVCRMRTGRELQFLEVLTSTPGINATLVNLDGNAPIHTACMHCRLESLKVLLSCESCDPNQQNLKGDTALHIVCRMSKLQFFEMLTSTPGINPTLVNHERIAPFDVVDSDGNTILHNACAEGNTTMVELLMKNGADVLRLNGCGDAPIHIACIHSQLDTMKVLWSYKRCDVNQQNSKGDTALHIVCRMRTGRELQFLEVLTSIPGINPILVNHEGIAPFDVVGTDDNTLLHIACAKGNSTSVEF